METDQELFVKDLATYRKVMGHNYMAHKEIYGILHQVLLNEAPDQFIFLDVACGTAEASYGALEGAEIGRYIGIDISRPSLEVARKALENLPCPVELRHENFVDAINAWAEPVDVVWIGQSLHHLRSDEKPDFFRRVRALLPSKGLFLIWEPTCLEGEDRDGWMERFRRLRPEWSKVTDEEFEAFESHCRKSDYSETAATWLALGQDAGFTRAEELLTAPNRLARVYLYRH